ncbi:MAG: tRNA (N6-isopentenyl adenosine(37)-C2)-methylthiotransferase MiaB [Pseudomonadota bacterium]
MSENSETQNRAKTSTQAGGPKKGVLIKTWGCQMNVYDSERMADVLAPMGYAPVEQAEDADLVILNTCHIREKATEKVFSDLGRLRPVKKAREAAGKKTAIAVAGCVAQAEGEEITRRAPYVDMVFGPQSYHALPEMIAAVEKGTGQKRVINTDFAVDAKFDQLPEETQNTGPSAFLSVQEGCDKFCAFCVVPYTRGAEFSRPVTQVVDEAKRLVASGARELTLLGQNVNAYHGEAADGATWGLARLMYELAEIDGLDRLRYTTSHPRDMDDALIKAHGDIPALMPFLHLPVQAGSDRVLDAMNRKHTADDYRRIIDRLRDARPDLALSSDFIVGFPGESDKDFADTLRLITDVEYAQCYSFKYSTRPGTPAADAKTQVPEAVKSERLQALQQLVNAQQDAFNRRMIGQVLPVLFDRKGRVPGQLHGRSPHMQSMHVSAHERLFGQIVDVKITGAKPNSLTGDVVTQSPDMADPVLEAAS